ncbi:MFS transporter [Sphingomonas sp. JC676]|uniref:MFS transporter n=1 Tax=Sphingomonas sp. JC676 TaxID=2768065 RepID=UPI0016577CE0|nr:MFS transporter [Sphingomonas sp. JC676]MBC9031510.1 MFS transporter [Sphingomonas sp. JC676]
MQFHHRAVPIVLSAVLIDSIGFGIVLPVLPRLVVELAHVGLADATRIGGYMLVAFALAQFFAGPILGSLGDSIGRRPVLLFSMLAFAADYALMAAAPTIGWLFVGRVVAGIAGAVYGPANAVLADVTPPEKRGATFGLMGAAFGIGFILGPALGGLLASFGPRAPFIAAAVLAGLNALWILIVMPETMTPDRRRPFDLRQAHIFAAFKPLFHAGNAKWLLLAAFLWQFAHMVYPATWAFFAELALGWNEQAIGWSLAASGLAMATVQMLVTGKAIARYGEERTVVFGMLIGGSVFACYSFVREGWMIYCLIAAGALQALAWPSINALLSRITDASHQGALQGGMASLNSVALIFAPLVLSQTLAFGSERGFTGGNFVLAAALAFSALLIVAIKVVPRVKSAPATVA